MDDTGKFKSERRQSNQDTIDSELIGIVYEAAFDPNFWPDLLEGISQLFNKKHSDFPQPIDSLDDNLQQQIQFFSNRLNKGETQRLAILLPHLYRALKLKREYNDADHSRGQAHAILEQFPFGVLLVTDQGKLISANQHALKSINDSHTLNLVNDELYATTKALDQQLKSAINKTANAALEEQSGEQVVHLKFDEEDGASISLLITPDLYPLCPTSCTITCSKVRLAQSAAPMAPSMVLSHWNTFFISRSLKWMNCTSTSLMALL